MIALGILLGGGSSLLLEFATVRARLRARRTRRSPLPALVGGFLARAALLIGGTLLGAFAGLWSPAAFLASCAAILLLGEAYAFVRISRPGGSSDSSSPT